MSFYRVRHYSMLKNCYQHTYFRRDRGGRKSDPGENAAAILEKLSEGEKVKENLLRARRTIRDLILCNKFDYFCTFTFNAEKADRYDFGRCKKRITEVFKNYKNRYSPEFRYVIVPEFHKDGAVHFHGVVRGIRKEDLTVPEYIWKRDKRTDQLLLVPNTKKYVDWSYYSKKLGFFSCSRIKSNEGCAWYVSKYITKDLMHLQLGRRVFMASEGLNRPELIFDADDIPMMFEPTVKNKFVEMAYLNQTLGVVPEWWGECCSDLRDPLEEAPKNKADIFFPRLTGSQLRFV